MTDLKRSSPARSPAPSRADRLKVAMILWMRRRHIHSVGEGSVKTFRRRGLPTSGPPLVGPACDHFPELPWLPHQLVVADQLPPESKLPSRYELPYYGLGKLIWSLYGLAPLNDALPWQPSLEWNSAFPSTADGWQDPTSDDTFARLRLQGPNPWLLHEVPGESIDGDARFVLDFRPYFKGVFPDVVCEFFTRDGVLGPESITVDGHRVVPGEPGWDNAKRIANALDARYVVFVRHLLHTHLLVGQAFALSAFTLPPWHPMRPFLEFFTYGTMRVNDIAYMSLLSPSSYFLRSGFVSPEDVRVLYENAIEMFDLDDWLVPHDLENRHLDAIADHPYRDDATLVWPAFQSVVDRHLDDLRLGDEEIRADLDLQRWYLALASFLPNTDVSAPLGRERLSKLLTALLYNNVIHEVCGDMSPIMGSQLQADRSMVNLSELRSAVVENGVEGPLPVPSMEDAFLMDQASYVSRFNVGGNNMIAINAAKFIADPKLRDRVIDLQNTLRDLEEELSARNRGRQVTFARMLPSNWEASISF